MLKQRVIPSLLLKDRGLVKTVRFKNPKYIGDPINAIRIFNEKEVDEILLLDIYATKEMREPNYELISQIAGECFIPLTYGGGIESVDQADRIFASGVEKICIQTAALQNPHFISTLANKFGSQSIVISIDVKRNWHGRPIIQKRQKHEFVSENWITTVSDLVNLGAGEVLLTSIDREGTLSGPDLELTKSLSERIDVPLIYSGGVARLQDIKAVIDVGASAVSAGAFFVFYGTHRAVLITYPKYSELEQLFNDD